MRHLSAISCLHASTCSKICCHVLQVAAVWTWLAQRFGGELFPGIEEVRDTTQQMVQLMEQGLQVCCHAARLLASCSQMRCRCTVSDPNKRAHRHDLSAVQPLWCCYVRSKLEADMNI
jgi:hypothetical protein